MGSARAFSASDFADIRLKVAQNCSISERSRRFSGVNDLRSPGWTVLSVHSREDFAGRSLFS
jgi:hypothetical protein